MELNIGILGQQTTKIKQIRKELLFLYKLIKEYEEKMVEVEKEKITSKQKSEELKKELKENTNLTKLDKMKKQMDLILLETKGQETIFTINETEKKEILEKIKEIECIICFAIRINTAWCPYSFDILKEKKVIENIVSKEYLAENKIFIEEGRKYVLEPLKSIYEYYTNAREILKNNKEKLLMLEELIDEMAAEFIKKDMERNNVILPDFVEGMKYFKHENEEDIEDAEIVD